VQAYLYPTLSINLEDVSDLLVDAVPILTSWGGVKESVPQQSAGSEPHLPSESTRPPVDSQAASTSETEPVRASQAQGAHLEPSPSSFFQQLNKYLHSLISRTKSAVAPLVAGPPATLPKTGPLKDLSWHSSKQRLAVIGPHDRLLLYDLETRGEAAAIPGVLAHEFQKGLSMVQWRPKAAGGLAAACR
jgi:hypothetical protein